MSTDLPSVKIPAGKVKVRGTLTAPWGDEYRVIRPNALLANALMSGPDGEMNLTYMNDYIVGHIHPDDRDDFKAKAMTCDTLDAESLMEMMAKLSELAYGDLPSQP